MEKSVAPGSRLALRDADLVEHDVRVLHDAQADLVGDLRGGVPGPVRLHDEALDLLVGDVPGPDQGEVRDGAGPDPALGAVDDPLAVLQPRRGRQAAGDVRAVVRLGQGEGSELGEGGEAGEPAGLLLLGAELIDHADDQFVVDAHERGEGDVGAGHLDVHEALEELGRAVRLQPAQAVLAEFREQAERELLAVPVVDRRGPDPGLQEFPDLLVPELFVRRQQVHDVHQVGVGKRRLRRGRRVRACLIRLLVWFRCGGTLSAGTSLWLHGHVSLRHAPPAEQRRSSKPLDVLVYCRVTGITRQAPRRAGGIPGNGAVPPTARNGCARRLSKGAP